jgi:hypothetical protein
MRRRRLAAAATALVLSAPAPTSARVAAVIPPAGPWPAPINGLANPLTWLGGTANGLNATPNPRLSIWLPYRGHHHTVVTRSAEQRIVVRGVVGNGDTGKRIKGATLVVVTENPLAPGWWATVTTVTDRRGRYTAVLPPAGHRRIAVVYFPDLVTVPLATNPVLVRARSVVHVRRPRHTWRRTYRFPGWVTANGAPIPAGGLVVAVQARNSQGVWLTVKLARTNARGGFWARYRFPAHGVFRTRVIVPAQPGWPFYAGVSRQYWVRP